MNSLIFIFKMINRKKIKKTNKKNNITNNNIFNKMENIDKKNNIIVLQK